MDKWKPAYMLASAPFSQQTAFSQQIVFSQLAPNKEQKTNWSLSGVETTCKSED